MEKETERIFKRKAYSSTGILLIFYSVLNFLFCFEFSILF